MNKTVYRFWDKEDKMMTESMTLADLINKEQINYVNPTTLDGEDHVTMTQFDDFDFENQLIPMLRSGSTDNNGKRMFDQDVVKIRNEFYIVQFDGNKFRLADVRGEIPFFEDKEDWDYNSLHDSDIHCQGIIIVGNWFEMGDAISIVEIAKYSKQNHMAEVGNGI